MIRLARFPMALAVLWAAFALTAPAQTSPKVSVEVVKVVAQKLDKKIALPGDLFPYQSVAIHSKVTGFVKTIDVDRGSWVEEGQLLATITAPELQAQRVEAEAKMQSVEAQRIEAAAKLAAAESTYQRFKAAAATPGVVAANDLEIAQKTAEAERARVQSLENNSKAAQSAIRAIREMESYLQITAPFNGVVTERNVHPGSLVGPSAGPASLPLVRIEQVSKLRLVVAVPEANVGGIVTGTRVNFTVPAFPGETFYGIVQRLAHSLDMKTRSMPVELDVNNPSRRLAPGMFADVIWPLRRNRPTLFVPSSAIVTTTERSFVIRIREEVAEWVDVIRGVPARNLIEVFGELHEGDLVARRGTDEIRAGTRVTIQMAAGSSTP